MVQADAARGKSESHAHAGTELAVAVEVLDVMKARVIHAERAMSQSTVELHRTLAVSIPDVVVAAVFALVAGIVIWNVQRSIDAQFFVASKVNDVWFEADMPTVAVTVLHRWSVQSRNARQPDFCAS